MPLASTSTQLDMRVPFGSNVGWTFSMYQADGITPFVVAGHTFEYIVASGNPEAPPVTNVIRLRSDQAGSPLPVGGGLLTVINTAVQTGLQLALYPPATTPLAIGAYYHALWMDYADPVNALNLWWGQFYLDPAVQP